MPYGHLIAATVTTLGVCQGHGLTASFILYSQARRAVPLLQQSFLLSDAVNIMDTLFFIFTYLQ